MANAIPVHSNKGKKQDESKAPESVQPSESKAPESVEQAGKPVPVKLQDHDAVRIDR